MTEFIYEWSFLRVNLVIINRNRIRKRSRKVKIKRSLTYCKTKNAGLEVLDKRLTIRVLGGSTTSRPYFLTTSPPASCRTAPGRTGIETRVDISLAKRAGQGLRRIPNTLYPVPHKGELNKKSLKGILTHMRTAVIDPDGNHVGLSGHFTSDKDLAFHHCLFSFYFCHFAAQLYFCVRGGF